jgi:hypothetical protein
MFLIRLVLLPVRLSLRSLALGYKLGSFLGYRRLLTFATGVVVGLLLAPVPGAQLRRQLQEKLAGVRSSAQSPDELAELVRAELARSPRTWHLPQPQVGVESGRVVLQGEVPHTEGLADIERAVAAVPGVATVDNRVVVSSPTPAEGNGAGSGSPTSSPG